MHEKLIDCFTNPAKNQLFMAIDEQGEITAKELAQIASHIPQATLYRYLKKMVADGLIKVVAENQIRNVKEKVYSIAIDFDAENEKIRQDTSGETFLALLQVFTNALHEDFKKHISKGNSSITREFPYLLSAAPIIVSDKEALELIEKLRALLKPYHNNPLTEDRALRNFALVITPPTKS